MHAPPTACKDLATVIVVSTFVLTIVVAISLVAVTIISVTIMSIAIISIPIAIAAITVKVAASVIAIVASLVVITIFIPVSIAVAVAIFPSPTVVGLCRRQCRTASHQSPFQPRPFSPLTRSGLSSFFTLIRTHKRSMRRFSLDKFGKDCKDARKVLGRFRRSSADIRVNPW